MMQHLSQSIAFTVIGASGYIGSKIVDRLMDMGYCVLKASRRDHDDNSASKCIITELDSLDFWLEVVEKSDVIIHLAGNTSINVADEDPLLDMNSSVLPIYRLIEACRILDKHPKIVFASTATVYGFTDKIPVPETTAADPYSFYDLHKFFVEQQLILVTKLDILDGVSLRLANVYGPSVTGSSAADRGILNNITRLALAGDTVSLYGGGNYLRDYVYIDDVIDAFIAASMSAQSSGKSFNIGSGVGTTIRDAFHTVAEEVFRETDIDVKIQDIPWPIGSPKIDMRNFVASVDEAQFFLNWSPKVILKDGIATMVQSIISQRSNTKENLSKI
jgi:nucleoside-diphosphate-sugar epimerase